MFIAEIEIEKKKVRTCSRISPDMDISESLTRLKSYLVDNFSFNPTNQEIFWLTCRYLFSKFPGFRGYSSN